MTIPFEIMEIQMLCVKVSLTFVHSFFSLLMFVDVCWRKKLKRRRRSETYLHTRKFADVRGAIKSPTCKITDKLKSVHAMMKSLSRITLIHNKCPPKEFPFKHKLWFNYNEYLEILLMLHEGAIFTFIILGWKKPRETFSYAPCVSINQRRREELQCSMRWIQTERK